MVDRQAKLIYILNDFRFIIVVFVFQLWPINFSHLYIVSTVGAWNNSYSHGILYRIGHKIVCYSNGTMISKLFVVYTRAVPPVLAGCA